MTPAIAVPLYVVEAAVAAVLQAQPAVREQALRRERETFRSNLRREGCPRRVAEAYAISFERAVMARVDQAGGVLQ